MNDLDLRELYQEVIISHNKNPHNKSNLSHHTHDADGYNPLCGDKVHIYLKLNDDETIEDISFEGEGCAISVASASMMTKALKGKSIATAKRFLNTFQNACTETTPPSFDDETEFSAVDLDELSILSSVRNYPMRVKCATLAWHTLDSALPK